MAGVWIRSGDLADFGAVSSVFSDGESLVGNGWNVVDFVDVESEGLGGGGGAIGDGEGDFVIFIRFAATWSAREGLCGGIEIEPVWFFGGRVGEMIAIFVGGSEGVN